MKEILEGAAVIAAMSLYLIPSIEADARGHHDAFAITLVNVLLGWTVVGWFAARAWAHSRREERLLRAPKRIQRAAGRVTSQKIVQHAQWRAAMEARSMVGQRDVKRCYS
ncbi:superinfection immunity protein [Paraburkholderia silviterrae]|uniref:Superinfection immunity protein n=1 Tax=Paraburkholderia silviterrae TaxID=2528715 RepID=A0A4V2ZZP2_9BURK|nr:superinfection immunity protein [Paraburkholderia silviterrae]TDG26214.1 superinfection immunity protein [Paraburkholderia silviterrae]